MSETKHAISQGSLHTGTQPLGVLDTVESRMECKVTFWGVVPKSAGAVTECSELQGYGCWGEVYGMYTRW